MRNRITVRHGTNADLRALRTIYPEYDIIDDRPKIPHHWWIDVLLMWIFLFGVWPFADPGHGSFTLLVVVDLALHGAALWLLWGRWKVVRR